MDAPTYPGKGLLLSQLIFTLNEELRRVTCSSGFALDEVSQFDRDLSNALAAVREWRNSFAPINVFDSKSVSNLEARFKYFVFPNLTTLRLDAYLATDFNVSDMLGFLKASPTLQEVEVDISGNTIREGTPHEMVVVLPNVKTFFLSVLDDGGYFFDPARISCPATHDTSLMHRICDDEMALGLMLFPDPDSWKAITRQYSTSPVEEVMLEIDDGNLWSLVTYSLTFRSSDATIVKLEFETIDMGTQEERLPLSLAEVNLEIFSQACRTIRDHPLLSHVKRFHIINDAQNLYADNTLPMAHVVGELLGSLGPLDEFTIDDYDLRVFLAPFVDLPWSRNFKRIFPPVKHFIVFEPWGCSTQQCMDAIVELAKSQHELEKPFDRVTIHAMGVPAAMAKKLRQWVGTVDCCK